MTAEEENVEGWATTLRAEEEDEETIETEREVPLLTTTTGDLLLRLN